MIHDIRCRNINEACIASLEDLKRRGHEVEARGLSFKEITDYSFVIEKPTQRILTLPFRYNNIMATIAEAFWVFSGRNDMAFITKFLPNAIDYSDNGNTWGGAYSPRLRNYTFYNRDDVVTETSTVIGVNDQINMVIEALQKDRYTRQAIIIISQPPLDYDPNVKTKDRPCTIFIQFLYRHDKLDCYVRQRSGDAIWGVFNINVVEWTFLHEVIAGILNVKIGEYHHNIISFHYYKDKEQRVENMLAHWYDVYRHEGFIPPKMRFRDLQEFYHAIDYGMKILDATDPLTAFETTTLKIGDKLTSTKIIDLVSLAMSFILTNKNYKDSIKLITNISDYSLDLKIAGLEYFYRWMKKKYDPYMSFEDFVNIDRLGISEFGKQFITGNYRPTIK